MKIFYSLYDRMLNQKNLEKAFKRVKSAKGAAGIDGQTLKDFAQKVTDNLNQILLELKEKSYRPQPVKRVEIPKPNGGVRKLGIPTVRDRVVQQVLLDILQPIFDPHFHPSSYGYRPGRSCHQAITKAQMFMRTYELQWVIDMDLSKCFDTLDHALILEFVRKRVRDGSILNLLSMFLKSGVMTHEGLEPTLVGSPQGGVISPLIANIYLDAFDQHMMKRNYRIVRYADDILIFTRSRKAAENAMEVASRYLETNLKLQVNQDKTHMVHCDDGVKYLGVEMYGKYTFIQGKKLSEFKRKVKVMTRKNSPVNLEKVIKDLNPVIRGFGNYFRVANCGPDFNRLAKWIRRRLRAKQLALWKKPKKLRRRLRQVGARGEPLTVAMNRWKSSKSPSAHTAMPNKWFLEKGLFDLSAVKTRIHVSLP